MKARVVAIIETRTGRFARMLILGSNTKPGTMRLFDIPGEDYQIGDKVWFTPAKIVRKLAVQAESLGAVNIIEEMAAAAGEFDPKAPSTFIPQPLTREELADGLANGHMRISADPAEASVVDICQGCAVCRPESERGFTYKEHLAIEESINTCFGHDTIHREPEGA